MRVAPKQPCLKNASLRNTAFVIPKSSYRQQSRRGYASRAFQSGTGMYAGLAAVALLGGAGYYFYQKDPLSPGSKSESITLLNPKYEDYQRVYNEIAAMLVEKDDYDDGSYGPILVRLAWHASGTYDKETRTGGSNGATMRFPPESQHGANNGLQTARDFLEPVKGTSFQFLHNNKSDS